MGLRDYLAAINGGADQAASANTQAQGIRQQALQQQLAAAAPQLIAQNDMAGLAGQAAQAGDMNLLRDLASNKINTPQAFDANQLQAQGLKADQASQLAGLGFKQQQEAINNIQSEAQRKQNAYQFGAALQDKNNKADAKAKGEAFKDYGKISKDVSKAEKELNDSTAALRSSLTGFQQKGSKAAMNLLVRSIISATGDKRISDEDIKGLNLQSFGGDVKGYLQNYLDGGAEETLSPQQHQELMRIANLGLKNADERKKDLLAQMYATNLGGRSDIVLTRDGKVNPQVAKDLKRYGLDVTDVDPNAGTYSFLTGKTKSAPADHVNPETGAPDMEAVDQQIGMLSNPSVKKFALNKMAEFKRARAIDPAKFKDFASRIQQMLQQK